MTLAPLTRSSHQAKGGPPPVLLAGGVSELSSLPVFSAVYRAYGWTTPIDPKSRSRACPSCDPGMTLAPRTGR